MIPKVIHKIWLSDEPEDRTAVECLKSWHKVLPDYEIRSWSMKDFDFSKMTFAAEAISRKKWAFATDYLRLYVLNRYGGLYLDSDVFMLKGIDEFMSGRFFSFVEYHPKDFMKNSGLVSDTGERLEGEYVPGLCIQAAFLGSEKGHPFTGACLDFYDSRHFILDDGSLFDSIICPDILAAQAYDCGFRYIDRHQSLREGMEIYESKLLAGSIKEYNKECFGVHLCHGSWRNRGPVKRYITVAAERAAVARLRRQL